MKAKKSLGQNFLKCSWVSARMIKAAKLSKKDVVVEIGPGKGALTKELLKKAKKVLAYEKDERMINFLSDKFQEEIQNGKLVLLNKDILNLDEKELPDKYKLIANIPYYITGKIIRLFLNLKNKPESITLLVQKEVAERIVSQKASKLSLSVKLFADARLIDKVPSTCFSPKPKVDSAIVHIKLREPTPPQEFIDKFFQVLQLAFSSPRKKLINNLSAGFEKEKLKNIFHKLNIKENARAEDLSIGKWKELVQKL